MRIDKLNEFADAQAVTTTAISENVMDLGPTDDNAVEDLGAGEPLYLVVITSVAATDAGDDATLTLTLESDDTVGLDSSPTVHFSTGAIAFANFSDAGSTVASVRIPNGDYQQYLGVRFTVASGPLTAGAFDAFLTHDVQAFRTYADRQPIAANA